MRVRMNCDIAKHCYVQLCSNVIKICEDRKSEFMQTLFAFIWKEKKPHLKVIIDNTSVDEHNSSYSFCSTFTVVLWIILLLPTLT